MRETFEDLNGGISIGGIMTTNLRHADATTLIAETRTIS